MTSKRLEYLERLTDGPMVFNWTQATSAEIKAMRRLIETGKVERVNVSLTEATTYRLRASK